MLEQQVLRQLTDDTQWDMAKEIKERGIDGGLDVTEVDGVPLTAVEAKMLAECSDDDRARFMAGAAEQRQGPPGIPGLGEGATTSGAVSIPKRTVTEMSAWGTLDVEPPVPAQAPATVHGRPAAASSTMRDGQSLSIVDSTPSGFGFDNGEATQTAAPSTVTSGRYTESEI